MTETEESDSQSPMGGNSERFQEQEQELLLMGCSLGREIMGSGRGSPSLGWGEEFEATLSHTQGLFAQ